MDWFLYDRDLRQQRVNVKCFDFNDYFILILIIGLQFPKRSETYKMIIRTWGKFWQGERSTKKSLVSVLANQV